VTYILRDEAPGFHHVVTRGNNKRRIFDNDHDRWFFCITVDRIAKKYGWTIVAYALMANHYHLIICVGDRGLSDGMCELNTGYAREYNVRHGRVNHLFGKLLEPPDPHRRVAAQHGAVRRPEPAPRRRVAAARVVRLDELRRDDRTRLRRDQARPGHGAPPVRPRPAARDRRVPRVLRRHPAFRTRPVAATVTRHPRPP
jgi:hypothetical protein